MGSIKHKARRLLAYTVLLAMLSALCTPAEAQTFGEWFNQKKTQKKYLLQQIAALQVYMGYLQKGYQVARSGLSTISDITNGEWNLHEAYINSLKQVNPAVKNDPRVGEIIEMQIAIQKAFIGIKGNNALSADNQTYVSDVIKGVTDECSKDLEELLLVITAGKVEMKDDERLERLAKVHGNTLDKFAFTKSFCNDVAVLIQQKQNEQENINHLKQRYERN